MSLINPNDPRPEYDQKNLKNKKKNKKIKEKEKKMRDT